MSHPAAPKGETRAESTEVSKALLKSDDSTLEPCLPFGLIVVDNDDDLSTSLYSSLAVCAPRLAPL